jgi:membrane-associated phospholipid phosphatase/tRNA A-37 threonylcarbamoyl transferase component Bud32
VASGKTEAEDGSRERLDDVAEDERFLFIGRRRRPSGDARPHPFRLRRSGWLWLGLGLAVLGIWLWLFATGRPAPLIERVDEAVLDAAVRARSELGLTIARALAFLGSVWVVLALRWIAILTLALNERLRHLVTFVVTALTLRLVVIFLVQAIGRPRPIGIAYAYGWDGYSHPSKAVAALAVVAVGSSFALAPHGRWRRAAYWASGIAIAALALSRVYLGVDHPSDALFAAVIGVAFAVVAFRVFCPSAAFPVRYGRGRAAHLEVEGEREERLRAALDEQAGLELLSVEPFGEESSGGSTPLRLRVRRPGGKGEEALFAKLYAQSHLRADRWYKLGRTIRYGALEDELAFNSVRQLVEHEDYMLRVMNDARIPTVRPRGFVELEPGREYAILMTFLRGAEEADEDADIDEEVIDNGLEVVRDMWEQGIAHRDIKPGNVMIRKGHVHLIDVAFGEMRPSPWRQSVDLANMMLVLALGSDAETVYARATQIFEPDEIAEAFAATHGITMPRQLRDKMKEDGRDLVEEFRALAPERPPIAVQRWSFRRVALTVRTIVIAGGLAVLVALNLANVQSP